VSYIRQGWPLTYVKGNSGDYIFCTGEDDKEWIEDYGNISDSGFIELLCDMLIGGNNLDDDLFKKHFIKRLASRLKVKLREKPLSDEESERLCEEMIEKANKEYTQKQ